MLPQGIRFPSDVCGLSVASASQERTDSRDRCESEAADFEKENSISVALTETPSRAVAKPKNEDVSGEQGFLPPVNGRWSGIGESIASGPGRNFKQTQDKDYTDNGQTKNNHSNGVRTLYVRGFPHDVTTREFFQMVRFHPYHHRY